MLEVIETPVVNAKDIIEGKPWVCLSLRELRMGFRFAPTTLSLHQPLVFDQLSKLTQLENPTLSNLEADYDTDPTFDFRLEMGLDRLSTLVSLRVLDFCGSTQRMNEHDVDWMLENWTELTEVFGMLHYDDPVVNSELQRRLRE
ncbi:hypothetical protein BGX31_004609, partial [Mortierella sp. GBA43]